MSRVIKESFYEISAKFEEEFENAEVVAKLEVIDIKLQKAKIILNKGEKNESIKI